MVKLTQHRIENRYKGSDYRQMHNLNVWGTDLDDINICTEMPLLEILSLSVNQLTTLKGLKNCHNLKELYLRKNLIEDISELNHLKDAKNLNTLWLLDNPCEDALGHNYRRSVIRHLPQLRHLDGFAITDAELRSALNDKPQDPPPASPNPKPKRASKGRVCAMRSNDNILSAIRCLIRELDPASLVLLSQEIDDQKTKMLPTD